MHIDLPASSCKGRWGIRGNGGGEVLVATTQSVGYSVRGGEFNSHGIDMEVDE